MAGNPYFMPMQLPGGMQQQQQQLPGGMQQQLPGGMQYMGGMQQRPAMYPNLLRPTMPMPRPFTPVQMNAGMLTPTVLRPPPSLLIKQAVPPQNPSTIYVGRLPEDCEDDFITNILLTCGQITKWKRLADPETGKLKSFGFCEYDSPVSALRALRLLKNLEIDDSKLLLNVDTKTQEALDSFGAVYKNNAQSAQQDEAALLRIRQLIDERAITHPPKPKVEEPPPPDVSNDEQNNEKEKSKERDRSSRKRDRGSRSRSREKRRKSSRSRSKERSSKKRSSRDRQGSRRSGRDRRSRSRSRGRRDRKGSRHSRSRSKHNKSRSPKREKKSKATTKSDTEDEEEKEKNSIPDKNGEDSADDDDEPPPPPPPMIDLDWDNIKGSGNIESALGPWLLQDLEQHAPSRGVALSAIIAESLESRKSFADLADTLAAELGVEGANKIVNDLFARLSQSE